MNLKNYTAVLTVDNDVFVYDTNNEMVGYLNEYFSNRVSALEYANQFGKVESELFETLYYV